jgi:EAL domain-containing protein (putative c-di-GMP-specific phosphodiesterase class I)
MRQISIGQIPVRIRSSLLTRSIALICCSLCGIALVLLAPGGASLFPVVGALIGAIMARIAHIGRTGRDFAEVENQTSDLPVYAGSKVITDSACLRQAIHAGQIELRYQPKLDCRTEAIAGIEALVRWFEPDGTAVPTDDFIRRAEQDGSIADLTLWVAGQAVADSQRLGPRELNGRIFINLSAQLLNEQFIDQLLAVVGNFTECIGLEITETAVIENPDIALEVLDKLKAAGFAIAIDDYGAGLSSLSYLRRIPATDLKIDKAFISGMTKSNRDPLIVRSTIDLCHALGMKVTAEGVEDGVTLTLLRVMGCDYVQGYVVAKPITLAELLTFIDSHSALPSVLPCAAAAPTERAVGQ